jgi:PKD domain-containing protein
VALHRRWRLLFGFAIAAIAFGSVPAVGASAAAKQPSVHPAAYVPLLNSPAVAARNAGKAVSPADLLINMDYNGGPVMPSNTDYMVLWSPGGREAYPDGFISGVERWFKDLAHDSGGNQNTDSVSAQYQDLTGAFARYATTFGGVLVDRQPYPASQCPVNSPVTHCLTDAQIQVELERFVAARGLVKDLSHEYFLMTPPHVETCFSNDPAQLFGGCSAGEVPDSLAFFCAYHGNTTISPFLIYANDPYVPGNPGCDDGIHPNGFWDGQLSGGLSHEQNESVTDPIPNDAWTIGGGLLQGFEVGDVCQSQFGTTLGTHNGAKYNQVINGHFYWYQGEWSNVGATCLERLAPVGTMPTATLEVSKGPGLTLNFDATGSTAPGGVAEYIWQFNDAFAAQTVAQTTPKISHTFPSAGAYSIGLTVFAHDGLSTGTGGIVTTGHSGISRGFTFSPSRPDPRQTVTFNALFATMSAQPVLVNLWEFGDGTVGAGANPSHKYAKPGSYVVTLVQFSGVGSAFPGAGAGPIVTQKVTIGREEDQGSTVTS